MSFSLRACSVVFRLVLVALLWSLLSHPVYGAPSAGPEPQDLEDSLGQIWSSRVSDVTLLTEETANLQKHAETLAAPLTEVVQNARMQFTKYSGLYQASHGHPTEQLTLVQQMHGLQESLQAAISPLDEIATSVNQRLQETAKLQEHMATLMKESVSVSGTSGAADNEGMKTYVASLAAARKKLKELSARTAKILAPAKTTLARINDSINEVEKSLIGVWEAYYLTPSGNTLEALASTPSLLLDWAGSLHSRMSFAYPQGGDDWLNAAKSFSLAAIIMIVLGVLGMRWSHTLPERWRVACERVIKGAWVWVGIGFAVLAASTTQYGGLYFAFALAGSLIIIAGVAALSWRLRLAVLPSLQGQSPPLSRLYPPAAIGVLMLFSDLPTRILGIVWGLVMLVFVIMMISLNRKHTYEGALPFLERLSYGCAFWLGLASLLVAAAGYARLAILVFMLLFALVNTVTLGSALMDLLDILADRIFSKSTQPIRNAIAEAIAIPIAWSLSLLCTLPWIWAVPGARYLIQHALHANYTVGEASFDFSKLIIIGLLYFLFRSFIGLGKTTLDHLPEKLPYIEKGVIPSFRFIVTYGFWALFGLISLSILGVNFTSLAVVVGGLSVGIGFGMQNIFNNLISGLMLIFGRTLLVGDYVDVAGASGTVKAINIRSTVLVTPERALVYVPNSIIMAGQLTNWTRGSRIVRRSIAIGVSYDADVERVSALLLEAAEKQEHVLKIPAPAALFTAFGNSSLDFTLNVFIDDFDNASAVVSELRFAVMKLFSENGIDIPFPQLTLHMPSSPPASEEAGRAPATENVLAHSAQDR